ncbi:NUDIX domain-containing protein [Candidatus Bipolaricaulota bacterium]|nr:NUDIX domain-containing protein [Candidatus Bipolaricaulota bacterium]
MHQKVFVYVVRRCADASRLLVFESLDELGYEVPKGSVDPGETLEDAARRELLEEAGLSFAHDFEILGTAAWRNERQTFFLVEGADTRDEFEHTVTGIGEDTGFV